MPLMVDQPIQNPPSDAAPLSAGDNRHLPGLIVSEAPAQIVSKLEALAKRGKMPGFEAGGAGKESGALFHIADLGGPVEGRMFAAAAAGPDGRTMLTFSVGLKVMVPWLVFVGLVLSAWPGVVLTESMLAAMLPGWRWLWTTTWYWYFPLAVISIPMVMMPLISKSRAALREHAAEMVGKIGAALGAERS